MKLNNPRRLIPALALCLGVAAAMPGPASCAAPPEVRVLIDVSGSMKKNDPGMLRAEGLKLLVGLLPPEARAGVWTFGKYVALDTPVAPADAAWKRRATAGADKIHSKSQNTDIEQALGRVITGWQPAGGADRHVILLTDGMVDVGKDPARNQASRDRILDQSLARLQALGVKVHTIALSSESDRALMQALSRGTDGWHEQIDSAEQLQRIFLRMFEKAAPRDTLPLVDNLFQVDSSVEELTLLVFRAKDAPPVRVQFPDGRILTAENRSDKVRWNRGEGYELVTVERPPTGEWQILADSDPDNRAMIVTNLKLNTGELPNNLAPEAHPKLSARLLQDGKPIADPGFLDLVKVELEHQLPGGQKIKRQLNQRGASFETTVLDNLDDGQHVFEWRADGGTFQRKVRQTTSVRVPVNLDLIPLSAEHGDHMYRVSARPDMIEPTSLEVTASLRDPAGLMLGLEPQREDENAWAGQLLRLTDTGAYHLFVTVKAVDLDGKPVELVMQPLQINGTGATAGVARLSDLAEPQAAAGESEVDWLEVGIWVGAFNLLIGVLGGLGFWLVRRRREGPAIALAEEV